MSEGKTALNFIQNQFLTVVPGFGSITNQVKSVGFKGGELRVVLYADTTIHETLEKVLPLHRLMVFPTDKYGHIHGVCWQFDNIAFQLHATDLDKDSERVQTLELASGKRTGPQDPFGGGGSGVQLKILPVDGELQNELNTALVEAISK